MAVGTWTVVRAGSAVTNMKHLSPTPPTGHLTPGQKEGTIISQMVQIVKRIKLYKRDSCIKILDFLLAFYDILSTGGAHRDQMSSGEYLITLRSGLLFI